MDQARVVVEHVSDTPGGLPAIWEDRLDPQGERTIYLYLRDDLPLDLQDRFRCMCVRDCVPTADWDDFSVLAYSMTTFAAEAV